MVCTSGLSGCVNPIHHSWYQWGSNPHWVQKVVSCFCHKAIWVGLVHWNRCAGVSGTLLQVGQSQSLFLSRIVSQGYFCRDSFVDYFSDFYLVIGFELMHWEFNDTPFDLVGNVIGPLELVCKVMMVEWKMIILTDIIQLLMDDGLVLNLEVWVRGW